jgi:general secretion pathway protein G
MLIFCPIPSQQNNQAAFRLVHAPESTAPISYWQKKFYQLTTSKHPLFMPIASADSWGKAYVSLNLIDDEPGKDRLKDVDKRKDHKENPINTLYDLYSKGKDGLSKQQLDNKESVDDVILAHDGAFIGLASDF